MILHEIEIAYELKPKFSLFSFDWELFYIHEIFVSY